MNALKHIPNLFTLGNLSCGVLAIINIFQDQTDTAVFFCLLAAVLDFFDGFLARLFKVSGELGKQLDSMADLVTFGIAPSLLLYTLSSEVHGILRYSFILLAVFSAYRLAKFNLDKRQNTSFIGVPTPITGIMVMSWVFIDDGIKGVIFNQPYSYLGFCILISYLLVSHIHLPSLKLKKAPLKNYAQHLFIAGIGLISLIFLKWLCVPIFYATYVLSSILFNFASKKKS